MGRRGASYYVEAAPPVDVNKNTEWFMYPGVWTTYILLLFFAWLLVLSVSGCSPGAAWTTVNLGHFAVCTAFLLYISLLTATAFWFTLLLDWVGVFFNSSTVDLFKSRPVSAYLLSSNSAQEPFGLSNYYCLAKRLPGL
jgi:hypothetical protein